MNTHDLKSDSAGESAPASQENLAYAITEILRRAGHPRAEAWMQGLHPDTWSVDDANIQRFHINRHLRVIINEVDSPDTMDIRFCLVDTGKIADWLRLFESGVAKWFANRDLPPAKS